MLTTTTQEVTFVNHMLKTGCVSVVVLMTAGVASAQITGGEKVYADQKCVICHSVAGKGNTKGPLDEVGSKLSADEIRQWIVDAPAMTAKAKADRQPPMKAFTGIAKGDLDALVAYLQGLKKK
jgi:mono/diheme cytochrome c family protein